MLPNEPLRAGDQTQDDNKMSIRVLLADDHTIVRTGLRLLIEAAGDMQVVGEVENGRQAVEYAARFRPQVVVMDLMISTCTIPPD